MATLPVAVPVHSSNHLAVSSSTSHSESEDHSPSISSTSTSSMSSSLQSTTNSKHIMSSPSISQTSSTYLGDDDSDQHTHLSEREEEKEQELSSHSDDSDAQPKKSKQKKTSQNKANKAASKAAHKARSNATSSEEDQDSSAEEASKKKKKSKEKKNESAHTKSKKKAIKEADILAPTPSTQSTLSFPYPNKHIAVEAIDGSNYDPTIYTKERTNSHSNRSDHERPRTNSASKHTAPTRSYDTFGSTTRDRIDDVAYWLRENGFEKETIDKLSHLSVPDLFKMTKTDLKNLCGVKEGIRLYTRLKTVKKEFQHMHQSSSSSSSLSTQELRPPGLYGYCSELDCCLPAPHICTTEGCERSLCIKHVFKSLLTSQHFCKDCHDQSTLASDLQTGLGWDKVDTDQCIIS